MRARRTASALFGAWLVALAGAGAARARLEFPAAAERILGERVDLAPARAGDTAGSASLRVECGDVELFGIAGLRASGARAAGLWHGAVLRGELVQVASPVGAHTRAAAEVGYAAAGGWQGAGRVGFERVALTDHAADQTLVAGVTHRVGAGRAAVIADVEVATGERMRATTLSLAVSARAGPALIVAGLRLDGEAWAGASVGVAARVHPSLSLLAGYDEGSDTLRAGVVVSWRSVEASVGLYQHEVLGASRGATVAWAR